MDQRSKHDIKSAATRARLTSAARALFGARGYAAVGTEEVVHAAGVTRGALYHHFDTKQELFAAVVETVEAEITARIVEVVSAGTSDPVAALRTGARMFLDLCAEPEIERIVLLDAPAVLGWTAWREIGAKSAFGLVEGTLQAAMDAGAIRRQPVTALAHVVFGALDECALYVAGAADRLAVRADCVEVLDQLIAGLQPPALPTPA